MLVIVIITVIQTSQKFVEVIIIQTNLLNLLSIQIILMVIIIIVVVIKLTIQIKLFLAIKQAIQKYLFIPLLVSDQMFLRFVIQIV